MGDETTRTRDAATTLLLVPGLACDRALWTPVVDRLAGIAEHRVCEPPTASSLDAMADRVLALAPPRFALAGHSMGGRIALEIIRQAPDRVQRLALLNTGWRALPAGAAGENERSARLALLALARAEGMRAMGRRWVRPMVDPARLADETLIAAIVDMIGRQTPDRFAGQIEALLARPDASAVLRAIRCPTLVLCGRQDAWSPPAQHREIAAMVADARLELIDGCGHMSPLERPEQVAAALRGWLLAPLPRRGRERAAAEPGHSSPSRSRSSPPPADTIFPTRDSTPKEGTMKHRFVPIRRRVLQGIAAAAAAGLLSAPALAADPLKIGLILPLTGPFASTGKQIEAACRLYIAKNGDTVAGRKVELIVKDDTGLAPETTKRIAQELVVQDKVTVLAGFGLTPLALAAAPVATEAKVPMVVMAAATSIIPTKSPMIVRTGFTLPQVTGPIADWAAKNKIKRVVTMVTDYGPGLDAEKTFLARFKAAGGEIVESIRTPLRNPDYAPFLQRAKDAKPDALFVFVPSGEGLAVMKQFDERGLKQAGIRLIGTGDVTDDDLLVSMGAPAVGVITSFHYSAAHDSPENKAYVDAFMKANNGMRPNFHSVGGYDGMHVIYEAVKKAGANASGEQLVEAMKGMKWMSPRGPMSIEPATRDAINTVYMREVKMVDGKPWNIEFDKVENVLPEK